MSPPHRALSPFWLILAWLLLNLVQAALTPLDPDETYYWMYAGQLDWGYFDHPPMVALLIGIGREWLPGALGLRFGHVLAGAATVAVIFELLGRPRGKEMWLAAGLIFAQPMLQVYGFIATPDGPLLLFTALYLLAYKRFLERPDLLRGLLWGLTMAGLLYSKYHGVLLIFFSVLPNLLWLLRRPGSWVAALVGLFLFAPHLYWQYANDYPSFRYHLSGRNDPYQLKFTTEYLMNQLLIFSPFLVYHYVQTFRKDRAADSFERSCRWLIAGFLLFFLYSTSKGGTEAQWTALLSLPLIYLTYQAARRFPDWQPLLWKLCLITGGILLVARLLLVAPREWLPFRKPFDHAPWVARLVDIAGDRPVIVENSYQLASLYQFYSGRRPAWTFTDVDYRTSQYDLWESDSIFNGQQVILLGQNNWKTQGARPFKAQRRNMLLREIDDFQVAKRARLAFQPPLPTHISENDSVEVRVTAHAPRPIDLRSSLPLDLFAILTYPGGEHRFWKLEPLEVDQLDVETNILYRGPLGIPAQVLSGTAELTLGLGYRGMPPLRGQSEAIPVEVR